MHRGPQVYQLLNYFHVSPLLNKVTLPFYLCLTKITNSLTFHVNTHISVLPHGRKGAAPGGLSRKISQVDTSELIA